MRMFWIKIGLFFCAWYEVSVELGLNSDKAFAVTLLVSGTAMMLLRLPMQIIGMLGPRAVIAIGPFAVWAGLAGWLAPAFFSAYPAFAMIAGALLALTGAAAHYVTTRYPAWFTCCPELLHTSLVPAVLLLMQLLHTGIVAPLSLAAIGVLIGLPLRLGWRFIPPASPHKFDARMGDAKGFRGSGFREER